MKRVGILQEAREDRRREARFQVLPKRKSKKKKITTPQKILQKKKHGKRRELLPRKGWEPGELVWEWQV